MNLVVNGRPSHSKGETVAELLRELGFEANQVAVALNLDFVPRSRYPDTRLSEGDRVEIVSPMQGG